MKQEHLFPSPAALPDGFACCSEYITPVDEAELLAIIRAMPLCEARYLQYTARRRIASFGGSYDTRHFLQGGGCYRSGCKAAICRR